jgi:hypothetical protein
MQNLKMRNKQKTHTSESRCGAVSCVNILFVHSNSSANAEQIEPKSNSDDPKRFMVAIFCVFVFVWLGV